MSEDWLITSAEPLEFGHIVHAVNEVEPATRLRSDHGERCVVLVDEADQPAIWVAPSRQIHDPSDALRQWVPGHATSHAHPWWTEVVAPAPSGATTRSIATRISEVASALADHVGGELIPLSAAAASDDDRVVNGGHTEDHPFDLVSAHCAVSLQTRPVLGLSAWVTTCLLWARDHQRTFVLLTPRATRLTPVLAALVDRGAVQWIADEAGVSHDAVTGMPLRWDGARFVTQEGGPIEPDSPPSDQAWGLSIEVDTIHPDGDGVSVGGLARQVAEAFGIGPLSGQGLMEPAETAFDEAALTAYSQAQSPEPARFVLTGEHLDGVGSLVPQPAGLLERVELTADAAQKPFEESELLSIGEHLLSAGAQLAIVGYRRSSPSRLRDVWPAGPVLPGLVAIRADRFPTLPGAELKELAPFGCTAVDQPKGWVVPFDADPGLSPDGRRDLLRQWDATLQLLSTHDALTRAQARQEG